MDRRNMTKVLLDVCDVEIMDHAGRKEGGRITAPALCLAEIMKKGDAIILYGTYKKMIKLPVQRAVQLAKRTKPEGQACIERWYTVVRYQVIKANGDSYEEEKVGVPKEIEPPTQRPDGTKMNKISEYRRKYYLPIMALYNNRVID